MIIYNDFERFAKIEWCACDTETLTYINGVAVTTKELNDLGLEKEEKFFREHASVRVWAWQISDGKHFFVTNDFDEFIAFFGAHKTKAAWFYNAKFDFAQIDYQLLTHTPEYTCRTDDSKLNTPWTFSSLHSDKGGRFSLKVWTPYKASGAGSRKVDRHKHTHAVTFYDFCNIFGGGLKRLLEEFSVTDFDGKPIRKSTMDYQNIDEYNVTKKQLEYMQNDTHGLYHLIRTASATLEELTGYTLTKAKPDVMTAGGLAKKCLLNALYPECEDARSARKAFQREHPLYVEQDKFLRSHKLYNGGLCLLNEIYAGKLLKNVRMRRYDVNSEYPFIMSEMPDIYGEGFRLSPVEYNRKSKKWKDEHVTIIIFDSFETKLKRNMIPCYRNPFTCKYEKSSRIDERLLMFSEEYEELKQWYDIDAFIFGYICYKKRKNPRYNEFVQKFYKLKNDSKRAGDKAKTAFAKLILNSSYGKLSERISREITYREINPETGAVHMVHTYQAETDEDSRLSVVQGAYITMGGRVWILSHIRKICGKKDVKKKLLYVDTDSIHTFEKYENADAHALGGFKDESPSIDGIVAPFNAVKYIAPKCYFDSVINEDGKPLFIEFHSKGISTRVIEKEFKTTDGYKHIDEIAARFDYGQKFQTLAGMNIRGGKALIPLAKYLAKPVDGKYIATANGYMEE